MSSAAAAHRNILSRPKTRVLVDVGIASVALAGSLLQLGHHGSGALEPGPNGLDWLGGALLVCATAPLLVWRSAPLAVFLLSASVSAIAAGLGYAIALPLGPIAALYLLAATRDEADPWTPRTRAIAAGLLGAYLIASGIGAGKLPASQALHSGLGWAVAWFAGERTRLLHQHFAELHDRAVRADRDAERDRRLAAAEERARIARDLHDSVGHAINVIAVRAGAARLRYAEDPARSLSALETIEEVARETADDIDQIVATLRDETPSAGLPASPIALASLPTLIEKHAENGLAVNVRTGGEPRSLTHAADQAAYRILQEALTNAARYGTGTADVEISFADAALDLTVSNPVRDGGAERDGGGHGLVGMRERATLLGGALEAGRVRGGFRLHAHLPYRGQVQ